MVCVFQMFGEHSRTLSGQLNQHNAEWNTALNKHLSPHPGMYTPCEPDVILSVYIRYTNVYNCEAL